MLTQNLHEGNDSSDKKESSDLFKPGEDLDANVCCHGHCICRRNGITSPCCSLSWKKPFDRALCGLSCCIVFLLLLGIITPLVVNDLVHMGIRDAVVIDSTSASSYDAWQSNFYGNQDDPIVVNYDIYLFDLQNEHQALNGSRPIVVERGPYAFMEYYNKYDISWTDDGNTVTYSNQKFFVFNPERTGAGLFVDDKIKLTYPTAVGFQYLLAEIPEASEAALDAFLTSRIDSRLLGIEETLQNLEDAIENSPMPPEQKNESLAELEQLETLVEVVRVGLDRYVNSSDVGETLLKLLLCENNPDRVSPYWTTDPVTAYFGWLNDPVLVAVQNLLDAANKSDVPWSTAVPGATTNYTSEADWSRRNNPIIQTTGKNNVKMAGQYIRYNNMTTQWVCVDSMASQDPNDYVQGEQFPSCQLYDYEWSDETAYAKGYRLAFATDYANRIEGGDGTLYGAPAITDKLQVYISDIYRTLFLEKTDTVKDWYDVTLHRYQIQLKDLQNASLNPEGAWYYNFAPSGMENLTAVGGLPLFVSKPHFLDGDTSLAGSVIGMSPKREAHDTFIDLEPNTGLMARAHKRLQIVYAHDNMKLPEIDATTVLAIAALCNSTAGQNISCAELDQLFGCLALPSEWKFHNDRVYMPYAWADENLVGTSDDADSIKDIYWIQDTGNKLAVWSFVVAGMCATIILGMFLGRRYLTEEVKEEEESASTNTRTISTNALRETNDVM